MKNRKFSVIICMVAALSMAVLLSACAKTVTVSVMDGKMTTNVEIKTGVTVENVLTEAGITVNENDVVSPALDEKITEDTAQITIERYSKVQIVDGDKTTEVEMVGGTVADALKQAGITVGENDHLSTSEEILLENGMVIEITHKRVVSVQVDGKTQDAATDATTVQELIDELGIKLGKDDTITPAVTEQIKDGDKIVIKRVKFEEVKETEDIPYETEEVYSDEYASGYNEVTVAGETGTKETTYKVKYIDGKEDSKEVVSEEVVKEPVNEVIVYGTYVEPEPEPEPDYDDSYDEPDYQDDGGVYEVSRVAYPNCADGSHGYYEITYSDGSVEYEEY